MHFPIRFAPPTAPCRPDNTTFIEPTELRLNEIYQFYYINWARTILHAFLPFVLLSALNGRIIHQIWRAGKIAKASSNQRVREMHRGSTGCRIGRFCGGRNFFAGGEKYHPKVCCLF